MPITERVNKDGIRSISGESDLVTLDEANRRLAKADAADPWNWRGKGKPLVVAPPVPPAPPRPDVQMLRAVLRTAIQERDHASASADKATEADSRAATLVAACTSELEGYDGIDQELAQLRADIIRSDSDDSAVLEIPAALGHRLKERTELDSKLNQLGAARALLAAEARTARIVLTGAESRVSEAAAAVLVSCAEEVADDFERAKSEMEAHLQKLLGVAAVWTSANGKQGPLQLGWRLKSIIEQAQHQGMTPRHDAKWHELLRALEKDADATFRPEV